MGTGLDIVLANDPVLAEAVKDDDVMYDALDRYYSAFPPGTENMGWVMGDDGKWWARCSMASFAIKAEDVRRRIEELRDNADGTSAGSGEEDGDG